jgi:hypothetical protein
MDFLGYGGPGISIGDNNGDGNLDVTPTFTLGTVGIWGLGNLLRRHQGQQAQPQDRNEYHRDGYYDQYKRWHPYR